MTSSDLLETGWHISLVLSLVQNLLTLHTKTFLSLFPMLNDVIRDRVRLRSL